MELSAFAKTNTAARLRAAASRGALSHALILSGAGDRNAAAHYAAAALECTGTDKPCLACAHCRKVLADIHPDVLTVRDDEHAELSVDVIRGVRTDAFIRPNEGACKVYIFPDCTRLNEKDQNVLLKTVEEGPPYAAFLFCAENASVLLPTIRSRTRIVNLAVPSTQAVAGFLTSTTNVEPKVAQRAARLAEGHIGIAKLYATDERVMSDRDELVVGVLNLARASDAVLLAGNLIDNAKAQAEADANRITAGQEAEFRRINGLAPSDRIPPKLRGAFNQIAKKDDVKRLVTRRTRDVLDRALNSIASIYRDVAVLQNNAEDSVGLINLENRSSITELSVRLNRAGAVTRLDEVAHARKRLAGNGNPLLVFESLFCALIS